MSDERQRWLWCEVRRALLIVVAAIERAYDLHPARRDSAKIASTE